MSYHLTLPPRTESSFSIAVLGLVLANLIPVCGVLFLDWDLFEILALYWAESGIIAIYTLLRMALCSNLSGPKGTVMAGSLFETTRGEFMASIGAKLFLMPFFCLHFGIFMFVHGIFLLVLTGKDDPGMAFSSPLQLFQTMLDQPRSSGFSIALVGLAVSHGLSFFFNYLRKGEYRREVLQQLMMAPYSRIIVMHLTLIGGAFLSIAIGEPFYLLLILVTLKIYVDARSHLREHRRAVAFAAEPD